MNLGHPRNPSDWFILPLLALAGAAISYQVTTSVQETKSRAHDYDELQRRVSALENRAALHAIALMSVGAEQHWRRATGEAPSNPHFSTPDLRQNTATD